MIPDDINNRAFVWIINAFDGCVPTQPIAKRINPCLAEFRSDVVYGEALRHFDRIGEQTKTTLQEMAKNGKKT